MTQWKSLTPHHLIHHLALSHLSFGLVESWLNWFAHSRLQVLASERGFGPVYVRIYCAIYSCGLLR